MKKSRKFKSDIKGKAKKLLHEGKYVVIDAETWEYIPISELAQEYKPKIKMKPSFIKYWSDKTLHEKVYPNLSLKEIEFIVRMSPYYDEDNVLNMPKMIQGTWWSASKVSKAKKALVENWILKQHWLNIYVNPIIWVKSREIDTLLIEIFRDDLERMKFEIIN